MLNRRLLGWIAAVSLLLLSACGGPPPTPTPSPTTTFTASPTPSLTPSATRTPAPVLAQPTATPTATASFTPVPTVPTLTPIPPTATVTPAPPTPTFTALPPTPTDTHTLPPTVTPSFTFTPAPTHTPTPEAVALLPDIRVDSEPQDIAAAGGLLWVVHPGGQVRVLTTDGAALMTVRADGGAVALATDGARLWVAHRNGLITQIDAAAGAITARWSLDCAACLVRGLCWDGGALWASNFAENTLSRIDPATGAVNAFPAGAESPTLITFDRYGLIVLHQSLGDEGIMLTRHNTAGDVIGSLEGTAFPTAAVSDGESLWLAFQEEEMAYLARYDALSLVETWRVPAAPINDLVLAAGSLWSADYADDSVTRRDPSSGTTLAVVPAGDLPQALAYHDGFLWVVNRRAGTLTRLWVGL